MFIGREHVNYSQTMPKVENRVLKLKLTLESWVDWQVSRKCTTKQNDGKVKKNVTISQFGREC